MKKQCNALIKSVAVIAVVGMLGAFLLPTLAEAQGRGGGPPGGGGGGVELVEHVMVEGASTREYYMYVPENYDSGTATPLLIAYHGFGGTATAFAGSEVGDLNDVADTNNFLIAYPQALDHVGGEKDGIFWDPADNGIQDIGQNDVYFTQELIADAAANYNIDAALVYAAGYSNGGMMSYGLACKRPDLIAAIGIMSGIMLPDTCVSGQYTSVIHFHGVGDSVLPYNGNQDYQSVADVVDFWLTKNNIPVSSLVSTFCDDGRKVGEATRDEYTGGSGSTDLTLYTVDKVGRKTAGHVWFSHDICGVGANQILWDFLSNYSTND
jgi:polyhydroxybutyrate depolymerase